MSSRTNVLIDGFAPPKPAASSLAGKEGSYWVILGFFLISIAIAVTPLAKADRFLFPGGATALAAWLLLRGRRTDYMILCVWLFLLTPWMRRLVDLQAGWQQTNLTMLAPYLAGMLCFFPVMKGLTERRFDLGFPFVAIIGAVSYGMVLAVFGGRVLAGGFDLLRWVVPPCFGLFVSMSPAPAQMQAAYRGSLKLALVLLPIYGAYQYAILPPWDVFWMLNANLPAIGDPIPFAVRVFSTMNGPGSYAAFLMSGLLILFTARGWLRWIPIALGAGSMLLTAVRTNWLGTVIGIIMIAIFGGSKRIRLSILGAAASLPIVLVLLLQVPQVNLLIQKRLDTFASLQTDDSANARAEGYRYFFNHMLPDNPMGSGLASTGTYATYGNKHAAPQILDGAILEIGSALGVIGGGVYLAAVLLIALIAFRAGLAQGEPFYVSCAAIVASNCVLLVGGSMSVGEIGMFYWVAVGFCLGARELQTEAPRSRPHAVAAA